MQSPTWLKPGILGAIGGAVVTMILGFSQGGWYTAGSAEKMAMLRSSTAVTDTLVPICVSQSKADPDGMVKLSQLSTLKSPYERRDFVMKAGWATTSADESPNSAVATACADVIAKATSS